jgi:hypothetical protein
MKLLRLVPLGTSLTFGLASAASADDYSAASKRSPREVGGKYLQHRYVAATRGPTISLSSRLGSSEHRALMMEVEAADRETTEATRHNTTSLGLCSDGRMVDLELDHAPRMFGTLPRLPST